MAAVIRRYEVTDDEWERVKCYIPEKQESHSRGRPSKDSRTMFDGIFWIFRSGASWRDLPNRYGPWQTVYKRFAKWSEAGIFEKIFTDLAAEADMQDISIDSTCIKVYKASAGAKKRKLYCSKSDPKVDEKCERNDKKINALGLLVVVRIQRFTKWWMCWEIQFTFSFHLVISMIQSLRTMYWITLI